MPNLGLTAVIRSLAKMTTVGFLQPMSVASKVVSDLITNKEQLKAKRVHPVSILSALKVYSQGHGERGSLTWSPVPSIIDSLDEAIYLAFNLVPPTNLKYMIGVDVSGSMYWPSMRHVNQTGIAGLVARDVAAMLALLTAHTEPNYFIHGFNSQFVDLGITKRSRFDDVINRIEEIESAATDCAIPMMYALENKIHVDVFQVITDNETNTKSIHPFQALSEYRNKVNPNAKMIVLGCTPTSFSIAKPGTNYMLDIVGASTDTPQAIRQFSLGEV